MDKIIIVNWRGPLAKYFEKSFAILLDDIGDDEAKAHFLVYPKKEGSFYAARLKGHGKTTDFSIPNDEYTQPPMPAPIPKALCKWFDAARFQAMEAHSDIQVLITDKTGKVLLEGHGF